MDPIGGFYPQYVLEVTFSICIKEREQEEDDIVVISLACRECGTTGEDNLLSVKNFPVGKEEELDAAYESDM